MILLSDFLFKAENWFSLEKILFTFDGGCVRQRSKMIISLHFVLTFVYRMQQSVGGSSAAAAVQAAAQNQQRVLQQQQQVRWQQNDVLY